MRVRYLADSRRSLREGRLGIANLHGGLSPEYRGADCTFWALYNGEPEKVGCTLHWVDAGIDTGGLIAHVSPEIRSDDDELSLFWRSVQTSAEVYTQFVQALAAGERFGQVQPHKGRLYQVKQRGLRHDARWTGCSQRIVKPCQRRAPCRHGSTSTNKGGSEVKSTTHNSNA